MLIGASTHIKWILENGIFSLKENTSFYSTIFWDSLIFFDIVATVLLINRPKYGIFLTLIIITIDVLHNNLILVLNNQHINDIGVGIWATKYWMLIGQLLFITFVFMTIKSNLTEINCKSTLKNDIS
jgi:hypothetical protein